MVPFLKTPVRFCNFSTKGEEKPGGQILQHADDAFTVTVRRLSAESVESVNQSADTM